MHFQNLNWFQMFDYKPYCRQRKEENHTCIKCQMGDLSDGWFNEFSEQPWEVGRAVELRKPKCLAQSHTAAAAAAAKLLQSCPTLQPQRWQPTRLPCPWDSPGKNTGVGCHFLLQCMKVKSESEVAQSCPTPSDPMDCSLPGSSVHGIFQARVLESGAIAFSKEARGKKSK